eukprot:m.233957 g.233957  ORF g.233957 m.233957 type:complete len:54 (-) comp17083_c0_seq43:1404-1565(-)
MINNEMAIPCKLLQPYRNQLLANDPLPACGALSLEEIENVMVSSTNPESCVPF